MIAGPDLRAERLRRGLGQRAAGAQIGVTIATWCSWERGYSKPCRGNAEKLRAWLASAPDTGTRNPATIESLVAPVTPLVIMHLCERRGWQAVASEIGVPALRLRMWARGGTRPAADHEAALARLMRETA